MLDKLKSSDFTPYLHQKFLIHTGESAPCEAELLQVTELGEAAPNAPRKPFSILLRGPRDRRLPQKIYDIRHATLGEMEIFLVPVAVDEKGYHYEAVFN